MNKNDIRITAKITCSYVSNNIIAQADLPKLMARIHAALVGLAGMEAGGMVEAVRLVPAVPIKKSIMPDYIVSLEDGRKYKSLTRYLRSSYGMTPVEYRMKWGLPDDYPMVAPNYAKLRSELARQMGLGQVRK